MNPSKDVMPGLNLPVVNVAENQPEYQTLPCVHLGRGVMVSRFEMSDEEAGLLKGNGGRLNLYVLTGGPVRPFAVSPHRPALDREPCPGLPEHLAQLDGSCGPGVRLLLVLTPGETRDAVFTRSLYLLQWTGGAPLLPVVLEVAP
jgi:hypothetical protein